MRKILYLLLMVSSVAFADPANVELSSPAGGARLAHSISTGYAQAFLKEAQYLTYQHNLFNCGPTSIAIALNALHVSAPKAEGLGSYTMFTYQNLFTPQVIAQTGISANTVLSQPGLSLDQVTQILDTFPGVTTYTYFANKIDAPTAKNLIMKALKDPDSIVLANIQRSAMGQTGGGHFSPIGAYDDSSDSFLFVDVASFKQWGPSWIPASTLYQGMNTVDGDKSRGFIVVNYHASARSQQTENLDKDG